MTIWRMRVACCIIKDTRVQAHAHGLAQHPPPHTHTHTHIHTHTHTHTHTRTYAGRRKHASNMYYLLLSHGNSGLVNAPHCYDVIVTIAL
jgi:hypothetical protein